MTIETIQKEMEKGNMLPARAADLMVIVSAKFGRACDEYVKANAEYAHAFNKERANHKSDTAAERILDTQEVGLTLHYWKYQTKKAEQMMKALNTLVYLRTAEAKNIV